MISHWALTPGRYQLQQKFMQPRLGHNGGPPLDSTPEWGPDGIGNYFEWRAAHRTVWKAVPAEIAIRRAEKAESLGLTYREYMLELLDHGRYLQENDTSRIAEIKALR